MALGTNHTTLTTSDKFIPEMWSDDVLAAYKANLVARPLVNVLNHVGKKGDVIHIPKPGRGSVSAKAAATQVTLIADTATEDTITIDQHWEYSKLIEDIAKIQALDSMRRFYTDDAGYAMAKKVDNFLLSLGSTFRTGTAYSGAYIGGDGTTAWNAAANTNTGNGTALTDDAIRRTIQRLDDVDTPGSNRVFIVPPVEKRKLLGISRYTEQAFVGDGAAIRNGQVGNVYGIPVYVTTALPTVLAADATTTYYAALMFHKDTVVFVEQEAPRMQSQYKLEWLGDLMVGDMIFGGKAVRPTTGQALIVPST